MTRHCPRCSNDLARSGKTTTHHDILRCDACDLEWVEFYDELQPIQWEIDLSAAVNVPVISDQL